MKKVCVISTLNHNVGDDFVRTGILSLLSEVFGDLEVRIVHKHFPATVRSAAWGRFDDGTRWLPDRLSWRTRLSRLAEALPPDPRADLVLSSDILVQSGAPVYWKTSTRSAHRRSGLPRSSRGAGRQSGSVFPS